MIEAQWEKALEEWRVSLGADYVLTDRSALSVAETTTFATNQVIPAILRPSSRGEVQDCLRIANRFRVPLYPVSSGKNWGYGSGVPPRSHTAILDLGRINRIVDFSEKLAYVTVEPGVTQRQLQEFLTYRKSRLWMDATGSSPRSSLIGNTMERGFGHTPYGDHFANSCGLEVVLPNGECIETGYSRFANALTGPLHRWGVGPSLDGLFSQSNFGVVTRMSIWLMPAPEYFQAFFFRCDREEQLGPVIEALSRLRLTGALQSTVHVGNDYKVIGGLQQYPWTETNGETPLSQARMEEFRTHRKIGAWNGSGGLYGTKGQVTESRRLIRSALKGKVNRLSFLDDRLLALSLRYARPIKFFTGWDLSNTLAVLQPLYGLLKGIPTDRSLTSAYWRKRTPIPLDMEMDPDRDGCGLLWFAPILPADGSDVAKVRAVTVETLLSAGFEPMISLTLINGRAIACVISISFDRAVPGEDRRAMNCYESLVANINSLGYYSYRLGIQSMAEMNISDSYRAFLRTMKDALDPSGILAPGRYEPAERQRAKGQD
ncbi:MAG: FAD-binding oxidoreductase [Bryobacteraceae bacterium]